MLYIVDESITEYNVTEPVDLTETKSHLRITDTDNNTELTDFITRARKQVENYTGCSLVYKRVTLICTLEKRWELPYGPVNGIEFVGTRESTIGSGIPTWETSDEDWTVTGLGFQKLYFPSCEEIKIIYTVGYSSVPDDLKNAVLAQIYWNYENKGNENTEGICKEARELAEPYMRFANNI